MSSSETYYNTDDEKSQEFQPKRSKKRRNHFNDDWSKTYNWLVKGKEAGFAKCCIPMSL